MARRCLLLLLLASSLVASVPLLPFNDINVLIVTDVHSWLGGQAGAADYGDVLSFYERLQEAVGHDLYFVMNGDWIDGTGLAMNGDPSYLVPLIEKMPFDVTNVGNHELYQRSVIEYMMRPGGLVESFGNAYLSSNVLLTQTQQPLGRRYRVLKGSNSTIVAFGFLYDMQDHDAIVTVQHVAQAVEEPWFAKALQHTEGLDAVLVLAHMGHADPLIQVILAKIRSIVGDSMPVQFVSGHTHERNHSFPDPASASVEAGRFLDTVGFVSFPKQSTFVRSNATDQFQYRFLDPTVEILQDTLGVETLATEKGAALSEFIAITAEGLGLNEELGCIDKSYAVERSLEEEDSLWRLFRDEVIPSFFDGNEVFLVGKGAWRFGLSAGQLYRDDALKVAPFNETYIRWENIPGSVIAALNASVNEDPEPYLLMLPEFILVTPQPFVADNTTLYTLVVEEFDAIRIQRALNEIDPTIPADSGKLAETSTGLWLAYLSQVSCGKHFFGHTNTRPPTHKKPTHETPHMETEAEEEEDSLRLLFAGLAVSLVALLGAVSVQQRGRIWRAERLEKDAVVLEALREYYEEEGEFV